MRSACTILDARYYSTGTFLDDQNNHDIAWLPLMVGTDKSAFTPYGPAWLSVDPLANQSPDISPYAYCNWNPLKYIDPTGKKFKTAQDKLIADKLYDVVVSSVNHLKGKKTLFKIKYFV